MLTFYVPDEFKPIYKEFKRIANREDRPVAEIIREMIGEYVKVHAEGNPSFELDKWVEQPEFVGDPALRETNEKWDKYLAQCDDKDLSQLEGTFKTRAEQAKNAYLKKKGFRK